MTHDRGAATVTDLLAAGGDADPAVEAEDRPPLTHRGLRDQIEASAMRFAELGIARGDRVAVVLPGGPELATAFLGVAAAATAAPLNPAYRREEFEHYLADIGPQAVLTSSDAGAPVHEAAAALDIAVMHVVGASARTAGAFGIERAGGPARQPGRFEPPEPDDAALLLHTSGTTSRPKLVPLTQRNISLGARNVAAALALTDDDRCLGVMPLFHIHGIVASVLAPLSTGGSAFVTGGFNAFRFFDWLSMARPTWVTAVPAMHQAIVGRAAGHDDVLRSHTLRLIRSSSSPLPPRLMRDLEAAFAVPVLEAMGMTEAAHQVTSNPPPPGERREGTVGRAAGPEIAILEPSGVIASSGSGELVIRGANVTSGYEANTDANREAFVEGWFRTGDLASIDIDGYTTLTGRIKEMINRGGEKISPREVEEVLLDYAGVEQAVVFPAPHRNLGEDVAAAVVLAAGTNVEGAQLRAFVRSRLAPFKVPRTLLIVDEIPKGPTGKPQRLLLASMLGVGDTSARGG